MRSKESPGPQDEFTTSSLVGFTDSELDAIHTLVRDQELDLIGEGDTDRAEIADMITGPDARPDLGRAARIGGRVAAALFVEVVTRSREVGLDLHVDRSLSEALQREMVRRLLGEAEPDIGQALEPYGAGDLSVEPGDFSGDRWQVFAPVFDQDVLLADLLRAEGFRKVRVFERLRIGAASVQTPTAPPGVVIRPASDSELRSLHQVLEEAFEDHWGDEVPDFERWWHEEQHSPFHERERMFLALLDDEPAGAAVMHSNRRQDGYDYVDMLGVRRFARGRGVARYLLQFVLSQAESLGLQGTELDVDSVSPTGADKLYRSAGMHPVRLVDVYMKNLRLRQDGRLGWGG